MNDTNDLGGRRGPWGLAPFDERNPSHEKTWAEKTVVVRILAIYVAVMVAIGWWVFS